MKEAYFKKLLKGKLAGKLSKSELKFIEQFENKMLERNSDTVFKNDKHYKDVKSDILNNIEKKVTTQKNTKIKSVSSVINIRVAASVAILVTTMFITLFFLNQESTSNTSQEVAMISKTVPKGDILKIVLPDQSEVTLNSGSSISYPRSFNETAYREVILVGEAYFDVTKNKKKPFVVKTAGIRTTVLGTTFNINSYDNQDAITITLATGKVKVSNKHKSVFISPNQQIVYSKKQKKLRKKNVNASDFIDWKEGVFRLNNVTLDEAVKMIESKYGVNIIYDSKNIKTPNFSATFRGESLENVLKTISYINNDIKLTIKK